MQVYKVKRNQNIFDVAVSTHGSIEGIFDLLINNPDLSFHSQLKADEEIFLDNITLENLSDIMGLEVVPCLNEGKDFIDKILK